MSVELRPCSLLGWAYCNGDCNSCQATVTTTHTPYDPIEVARQYAPKFDKPVVDMVEVIRCKDCRFFHKYGFKIEYTECTHFDCDVTEDGYCWWAERKEAE